MTSKQDILQEPLLKECNNSIGSNPLYTSNAFSKLSFSWLNPLLAQGSLKNLESTDIPPVEEQDKADAAYKQFVIAWNCQKEGDPSKPQSVALALARCHWKALIWTGFCALFRTISVSFSPWILYFFINFENGIQDFKYEGYLLVSFLFLSKVFESILQRQWFFGARRIGLQIRSALAAAIYQKELLLSSLSRQSYSGGDIVSYISVDINQLGEFPWWFHQIWAAPVQITIAVITLFLIVGWAALPGLLVIIITAIIQAPFARAQQKFQASLMKNQDARLRTSTTIFNNMKIVKLQAWESKFKSAIESLRIVELKWVANLKDMWVYGSLFYWMSPILTASIVFGSCIIFNVHLTATVLFTVLTTFRVIQEPVRIVPDALLAMIQAQVALARLKGFLHAEELEEDAVNRGPRETSDYAVHVNAGFFVWDPAAPKHSLENINLTVKHEEFVAICGSVGSGKSTLLHSILGEVPKVSGSVDVHGSIAYVGQAAWIQSGTVRENILFGNPMHASRYDKVLEACALKEDLVAFSHGDLTEIGQRGVNLSGGQKQRLQLARALYSDSDIYILDDPFSAVDAQTAALLFKKCILGMLLTKTVILVTHQVEFLTKAHKILVMQAGEIKQAGKYDELLTAGNIFVTFLNAHNDAMEHASLTESNLRPTDAFYDAEGMSEKVHNTTVDVSQLTKDEEKEVGNLGIRPLMTYLRISKGEVIFTLALAAQIIFVIGQTVSNFWLATEVSNSRISPSMLVIGYAAISLSSGGFVYVRGKSYKSLGLKASKAFFSGFMDSLFSAPMSVFDSTPIGRILSRASLDMSILDIDIPGCLAFVFAGIFDVLTILIAMSIVTWQVLVIGIPMIGIAYWLQVYYTKSARQLMRINGITKAPIVNYANEIASGVTTIRAFEKQEYICAKALRVVDIDGSGNLHTFTAYEWVALRVEFLGTVILSAAALFVVLQSGSVIPAGLAGLSLSYALSLNGTQIFLLQWLTFAAKYIVSVERIYQYMRLPQEAPAIIDSNWPLCTWPHKGTINLQNLQVRYRETAPLILKGITCTFHGGQRIGIVGRTGSGKSTLISCLFRLVEPTRGRILIDDIDIISIGLHDLRSRLGIIPQEPFMFRGTVRTNIDPVGVYSDHEIWEVLEKCLLKEIVSKSDGLDSYVADDGENWSVGQRQLFSLARVLLKRTRILILDEATASIDSSSDSIIQKVIRKEFSNCTVITVAHRIPSVIDSDMILSLKDGMMVEYDTPSTLLECKTSLFGMLVAEYWSSHEGDDYPT